MKGAVDIVVGTPSTVLKYQQKGKFGWKKNKFLSVSKKASD